MKISQVPSETKGNGLASDIKKHIQPSLFLEDTLELTTNYCSKSIINDYIATN